MAINTERVKKKSHRGDGQIECAARSDKKRRVRKRETDKTDIRNGKRQRKTVQIFNASMLSIRTITITININVCTIHH